MILNKIVNCARDAGWNLRELNTLKGIIFTNMPTPKINAFERAMLSINTNKY